MPAWLAYVLELCIPVSAGRIKSLTIGIDTLVEIPVGMIFGCMLFLVFRGVCSGFAKFDLFTAENILGYLDTNRKYVCHLCWRAVFEELFWRGTVLYYAGFSAAMIVIISASFSLGHWPQVRKGRYLFQLFLVGLSASIVYSITGSLYIVIAMHWVKNVLVAFEEAMS